MSLVSLALIAVLASLALTTHAWAALYKCAEDGGRIVYSDAPCRPPPPPKRVIQPAPTPAPAVKTTTPAPPPAPVAPPFNQAINGKLSEALVSDITRKGFDLGAEYDFRSQCALAATDIKFTLTDQSSRPATVVSGGRREICDLQREAGMAMQAAQFQQRIETGKLNISINSAATQATVQFEPVNYLSVQGQPIMRVRCTRKDTLAVYQDQVLYKELSSVCKQF